MKLDTLGLQAFTAILDAGSFHKAAETLNISQTGLSRRLKTLEMQLGVRLIDRTTRSWSLTVVGEGFRARAQRLVQELEAALGEVKDAAKRGRGDVTLACVSTIACDFLPEVLLRYAKQYPLNRVKIIDTTTPDVLHTVLQQQAEFGVNVVTAPNPDVETHVLIRDPFVLICRDDHPLSKRDSVSWKEVASHSVIRLSKQTGNGQMLENVLNRLRISVRSVYEVQHPSAALSLTAAGAGVTILPRLTLPRGAYSRLRVVPLLAPAVKRELALIHRKNASLSPAAEPLYNMIRDAFAKDGFARS